MRGRRLPQTVAIWPRQSTPSRESGVAQKRRKTRVNGYGIMQTHKQWV